MGRQEKSAGRSSSWLIPVLVLVVGTFLAVLDVTIVNVAIPTIQTEFGVDTLDVQWIATAYSLTLGVLVPASAWLADRFGLRRVYIAALIGFAATSVLCGLAWDLPSMVAFRILQAVPGGVLPVITLTMVYRIVPPKQMGAAMGTFGLGVVLAPAIGPTLGGYLAEYTDWRLVFFINAPIALLGALAAYLVLTEFPAPPRTPFDIPGFATAAFGLFALLLAFTKAPDWGWTSYRVGLLALGGLLSLAAFVVIELDVEHPLLDVRLFTRWQFVNSLLLLTVLSVGMFAVLFYVPVFLQDVQGVTPVHAGLIMLPEAIVMAVLSPLVGFAYDQIGARWLVVVGLGLTAWGTYGLSTITLHTSDALIVRWTCIRGEGTALAMMAIITAGLEAVPADKTNEASATSNVAQRITSALGLALLVAMVTRSQSQLMTDRTGLVNAKATPQLADADGQGLLYVVLHQMQLDTTASAYGDMFLLVAVLSAVGAVLALGLGVKRAGVPVLASPTEPTDPGVPHAPAAADWEFDGPRPRTAGDDIPDPVLAYTSGGRS